MDKIHLVANTFQIKELLKVVANYAASEMSLRPARAESVCFIYLSAFDRNNIKRKDFFCHYCILYNNICFVSTFLLEGVLCLITWSV